MLLYYYTSQQFGIQSLNDARLKIARFTELNDPFDWVGIATNTPQQRRELRKLKQKFDLTNGLLCMSTSWDVPLLWSHYADKHKGMCLGFEVDDKDWVKVDYVDDLDFSWAQGRHAPEMVAIGNLIALIILSIAAAVVVYGREASELEAVVPHVDHQGDKETIAMIQMLLETRHFYRDPDLNLDRLARKAVIPARQISTAINRSTGKNVSQYVNEFRIAEACQLLSETEKSVTEIMLEVGFQTKSNFNREFRRVTDLTPVQWRQRQANPT